MKEVSILQVHRTRSSAINNHICNKAERPVRQPCNIH